MLSFLAGGGVYMLSKPDIMTVVPLSTGFALVHPDPSKQTVAEGIVSMVCYFFEFSGMYLSYQSVTAMQDSEKARNTLLFGMVLLIIGYGGLHYLNYMKTALRMRIS